ncbi:MAG TPA: lipoyl synthase [Terriglobia bacterium]|nr:lipoyl synthase [Terriglobia bacterium]
MEKRPDWLKVRIPSGDTFFEVRSILRSHNLNTICEDAMCPNIAECWGTHRTATFMILGDVCTRACAFCAVTSGKPTELDLAEPQRVAAAIADLKLRHAVITSVDRDDLADGGASVFADLVGHIRRRDPEVRIELLTPDFRGSLDAVRVIADAGPDIFSHNIETARRLYSSIRFKSDYDTSFGILKAAKQMNPKMFIKTGIMVGLGEDSREVYEIMDDAANAGVDIFTVGQYLRPSPKHAEIMKYYHPDEFAQFREFGQRLGLRWVFAGPLVRSSYHAEDVFSQATAMR